MLLLPARVRPCRRRWSNTGSSTVYRNTLSQGRTDFGVAHASVCSMFTLGVEPLSTAFITRVHVVIHISDV